MSDIVVIGGGVAGGAAAALLARAGQAVTLLEREREPHEKVCGEFVSVEAGRDLVRLGLDPASLGAVPIDRVRIHSGRRSIEAALPFVAHGLGRRVLDEALLETAARAGARIERGVRANGLNGRTNHASVVTSAGELDAGHILLATGKHDLRGLPRPAPQGDGYVGFKMHWRLPHRAAADLGSAVELVLFDIGYAGLQRIDATRANLCLVVRQNALDALGGGWSGVLERLMEEPVLASRLGDAEPLFARPLAIAKLPYGFVHHPGPEDPPEVWRLGDQAAATASLTGDGIAIALRSAHLAADALLQGATGPCFHRALQSQVGGQVRRAMRLQRLIERPWATSLGMAIGQALPGLLTRAAASTRLPPARAA